MDKLPLITLVRMLKSFIGKRWGVMSKTEKTEWILNYRKVEKESLKMISKYDSIENWYLSGEGRFLIYEGGKQ